MTLDISGHTEIKFLFVTSLAGFDIVLCHPWLKFHDPSINWAEKFLNFNYPKCRSHSKNYPILVKAVSEEAVTERRMCQDYDYRNLLIKICDANLTIKSNFDYKLDTLTILVEEIEKALREKSGIDPATILPQIYHGYLSVFSKD